jgi:ATP-dependent DNA helicase RecG
VTRLVQGLAAKGALLQEGQGRWSRYRLPGAFRVLHKDRDSEHKAGDSVHKDASSVHKAETSEHSADLPAIIASERVQQ